jgi:hypothetical protein
MIRPLFLTLAFAISACAQFFGLATPAAGSRVYFATTLRQKNSMQPIWGKFFQVDASGLNLALVRDQQVPFVARAAHRDRNRVPLRLGTKDRKVSTRPESRCYLEPPPTQSDQPDALDDAFAQEASVRSVAASGPTASPATLGLVLPKRLAEKVLPPVVGKAPSWVFESNAT